MTQTLFFWPWYIFFYNSVTCSEFLLNTIAYTIWSHVQSATRWRTVMRLSCFGFRLEVVGIDQMEYNGEGEFNPFPMWSFVHVAFLLVWHFIHPLIAPIGGYFQRRTTDHLTHPGCNSNQFRPAQLTSLPFPTLVWGAQHMSVHRPNSLRNGAEVSWGTFETCPS